MRNCEGLGNQGWGLYVSCLEGCVSVKWVEREGRMGVQRQVFQVSTHEHYAIVGL